MRVFSFAQESTRYCNYSKEKFGNELTYIIPSELNIKEDNYTYNGVSMRNSNNIEIDHHNCSDENWDFIYDCISNESKYLRFITKYKWTPQRARQVLSNALKTELVMTGFISDWKHFFELRTPGSAHPDARALAIPLQEEFKKLGYSK